MMHARRGGRYDEGACFAPAPLRRSLLVSHWGNTMSTHRKCTTTYQADRWDVPYDPYTRLPLASLIGDHACYDPHKDVVMPSFRELTTFLPPEAPAAGGGGGGRRGRARAPPPRRNLFFFSGELGS